MKLSLFFGILALSSSSYSATIANGLNLKILPLGDSITYGLGSSDGNGYRLALQNMLPGNSVQYIGSVHSGSMLNNSNEGHMGAVITQIAQFANLSLPLLPNMVLLMAGTNDMPNPKEAPDRLAKLIDELIIAVPTAVLLVAQLTPATDKSMQAYITKYNAAIPGIVAIRAKAKKKVLVVDMSKYVITSDLWDGLHPNDIGYTKMAAAWYNGFKQADSKRWISPAQPNGTSAVTNETSLSKSGAEVHQALKGESLVLFALTIGIML